MKNRGFTLIETLIAIAIVTIAVVGPLVTASRALVSANIARDQLSASYLASEGVEYVRQMRDTMYLTDYQADASDSTLASDAFCDFTNANPSQNCNIAPADPGASIASCLGAGRGATFCQLNDPLATMATGPSTSDSLTVCSGTASSCALLYLTTSGRYTTNTSGTATSFTRSLQFYTVGDEVEVVSQVSWTEHGQPYSTSITDYLSPWE